MIRGLALLSLLMFSLGAQARGNVAVTPGSAPRPQDLPQHSSSWDASLFYGMTTDLAEREQPRGYYQDITAGLNYKFSANWSMAGSLSGRFTTFDGKVEKGQEETLGDVVRPAGRLSALYVRPLGELHQLRAFLGNVFLLDEASRREGYRAIPYVGTSVALHFWQNRYVMSHKVSLSEVINSFEYSSQKTANPGTSASYELGNTFTLVGELRATVGFGIKTTRYMDGYVGYDYMNSWSLAYQFEHWDVNLSYANGGYTEEGRVDLWYIDQYRRLISLSAGYQF